MSGPPTPPAALTGPQPSSDPVLAGEPPLPFDTKAAFVQIYNTHKDWVDIEETLGEYSFMRDVPDFSKPGPGREVAPRAPPPWACSTCRLVQAVGVAAPRALPLRRTA